MNCKKTAVWSSVLLLLIAAVMHFAFEWLGKWPPLGAIFPVNESVFEHLKIIFYPMVVFWLLYPRKGGRSVWAPLAAGVLTATFLTLAIFYIFESGFGIESLAVDIAAQFIGLLVGQAVVCSLLTQTKKSSKAAGFLGFVIVIAYTAALVLFTFKPPKLPIFRDPPSGGYGIVRAAVESAAINPGERGV